MSIASENSIDTIILKLKNELSLNPVNKQQIKSIEKRICESLNIKCNQLPILLDDSSQYVKMLGINITMSSKSDTLKDVFYNYLLNWWNKQPVIIDPIAAYRDTLIYNNITEDFGRYLIKKINTLQCKNDSKNSYYAMRTVHIAAFIGKPWCYDIVTNVLQSNDNCLYYVGIVSLGFINSPQAFKRLIEEIKMPKDHKARGYAIVALKRKKNLEAIVSLLKILKQDDSQFSVNDDCAFNIDNQNNTPFVDVQISIHDLAFEAIDDLTGLKFNRDIQHIENWEKKRKK
jgi:hypothetical protein